MLDLRELTNEETFLEYELLESAIQFTQEIKEMINVSTYWQLKKDWAAGSMPANQEDWRTLDLNFRSNMWTFFYHLTGHRSQHEIRSLSPLQHVKFESFRCFRFAIWSTARMAGYGLLLAKDEYAVGMHAPYYKAWRNLLTQDERDAIDR